MRLIALLEYAAVLIGIAAVLAGRFFAISRGVHLGVFMIGAGIALGGLEALGTRRMPFRAAEDAWEAYAGTPAIIVGLMALALGAAVVASAYLLEQYQWHATVSHLMRRPAPALAAGGLLLIGTGTLLTLNPQGRVGTAWTLLVRLPRSLIGLVLVLGGLAGIALGVWEWLEPAAYDSFLRTLPQKLDGLFVSGR